MLYTQKVFAGRNLKRIYETAIQCKTENCRHSPSTLRIWRFVSVRLFHSSVLWIPDCIHISRPRVVFLGRNRGNIHSLDLLDLRYYSSSVVVLIYFFQLQWWIQKISAARITWPHNLSPICLSISQWGCRLSIACGEDDFQFHTPYF